MNDKARKSPQLISVFFDTLIYKQANVCYSFETSLHCEQRE